MERRPVDLRQVVDDILWMLRAGATGRGLPEEFGGYKTVWRLIDQWNDNGLLGWILRRFQVAFVAGHSLDLGLCCRAGTVV